MADARRRRMGRIVFAVATVGASIGAPAIVLLVDGASATATLKCTTTTYVRHGTRLKWKRLAVVERVDGKTEHRYVRRRVRVRYVVIEHRQVCTPTTRTSTTTTTSTAPSTTTTTTTTSTTEPPPTTTTSTTAPPATPTLSFGGYDPTAAPGTTCPGSSSCAAQNVPDPLTLPMIAGYGPGGDTPGAGVMLLAQANGSVPPYLTPPSGTLSFAVTPTPWLETGFNDTTSTQYADCSAVPNAPTNWPTVWGSGCLIYFSAPGSYTVTVAFASSDPRYASVADGETAIIDVTP
jgi:hypothetical protein